MYLESETYLCREHTAISKLKSSRVARTPPASDKVRLHSQGSSAHTSRPADVASQLILGRWRGQPACDLPASSEPPTRRLVVQVENGPGPQVSHSKSTVDCPRQRRSPRDGHASSPGDLVFRAPALAGSDDRRQRAPEVQLGTAPESSSLALAVNATAAARPGAHRDSTSTTGAPGAGGDCRD